MTFRVRRDPQVHDRRFPLVLSGLLIIAGAVNAVGSNAMAAAYRRPAQSQSEPKLTTTYSSSQTHDTVPTDKAPAPKVTAASPSTAKPGADKPSTAKPGADKPSTDRASTDKAGEKTAAQPTPEPEIVVGDPLAAAKVQLLTQEIVSQLKARSIEGEFMRFRSYLAGKLSSTRGRYTGNELTGNCRLSWYDKMLRNPLAAPAEAEQFTRQLHASALRGQRGMVQILQTAREKLDLPKREPRRIPPATSPEQAIDVLKEVLSEVQVDYAAALAPLAKSEVSELANSLYSVFVGSNIVGHTLNDRSYAGNLCDLMEKMDRGAMMAAAEDLMPLVGRDFLAQLGKLPDEGNVVVRGVQGRVLRQINTPAGAIVIGGRGKNIYQLDEMLGVAAVIDLGGDDEYFEGAVSVNRPLLVVIDLKGNDVYRGSRPGIQGGAILGVSLLVDVEGNDIYQAADCAQASALGGVGILVDMAGDDIYRAIRRVQGHALAGVGLLIDRQGNDQYRAAMWGQGFGAPLGFGLLDDCHGTDFYFAGGMYLDSYPETPGLEGWSQGVGAGPRQVAAGGIGVLLDGDGDDVYEFDYMSHGGGYWCGMGFLRDFDGDDQHLGGTNKAYSGGPRSEPMYQRFGCGFGCHYALGFCFDDAGDDAYRGRIMSTGHGWDCAVGVLCDFGGNDHYDSDGNTCQGNGAQASLGILFDYDGDDVYEGYGQGYAAPGISYHPLPYCGGNFSFLVDYGGKDTYGCEAENNAITQRGWAGGFIIDRPRSDETAEQEKADPSTQQAAGSQ